MIPFSTYVKSMLQKSSGRAAIYSSSVCLLRTSPVGPSRSARALRPPCSPFRAIRVFRS